MSFTKLSIYLSIYGVDLKKVVDPSLKYLWQLLEAAILECLKPAKARRINVIFKFYMNPISLDCWLYENSFIWDYLYHKFAWNSYHFDCKIVTWFLVPLFCIKSKVQLYINPYLRIIENGYITEKWYWFLCFNEWNSKLSFILKRKTIVKTVFWCDWNYRMRKYSFFLGTFTSGMARRIWSLIRMK